MSRTPDFLVIGAMKCGTTTLHGDLARQAGIFVGEKESHVLSGKEGELPASLDPIAEYRRLYSSAPASALLGDVCTTYSMSSQFPHVIDQAKACMEDIPKVVYIVREPLARIISHHHHDFVASRVPHSIDQAVNEDLRLIDYSRYYSEIKLWADFVGWENILVIQFERYMADRLRGIADLVAFLGLDSESVLASEEVMNRSAGKPVASGHWGKLSQSSLYRRALRPLLPSGVRSKLVSSLLPKAPSEFATPAGPTVDLIRRSLDGEMHGLASVTGEKWWRESPVTPW